MNDGAQTSRSAIPAACRREPYMPEVELRGELAAGVVFWAYVEGDRLPPYGDRSPRRRRAISTRVWTPYFSKIRPTYVLTVW